MRHTLLPACLVLALAAGCLPATPLAPTGVATPRGATQAGTDAPPTPSPGSSAAVTLPSDASPCPVPPGSPPSPDLQDPARIAQSLLAYLNAGGNAGALPELLQQAGRAGGTQPPTLRLDLNGDYWLDLAVAWVDLLSPQASAHAILRFLAQPPSSGSVLVFVCQGGQYSLGEPLLTQADRSPVLYPSGDFTGDRVADLLIGWETCGAHTCYQSFEVVSGEDLRLAQHPLTPTDDLPYPDVRLEAGGEVAITGTGIGSVGAGPFRRLTRTWRWEAESQTFAQASEALEPARFRIHLLLDAEAAARRGEWDTALELYHRVILDDTLLDWVDPAAERANLTGYSMYRVVVMYVSKGDLGDAQVAFGILQNQYPADSTGRAYADLGSAFWGAFGQTQDLGQSCLAAQAFAKAHTAEVLDPLYFGYANPAFNPEDVCPTDDA